MKKITFFDVEYANATNKSICQIGVLCQDLETGDPVYPELNIMINPEDGFDQNCINVHGITKSKVENEPNFKEVWFNIEKYFTNAIIVGHNVAGSDINALVKNLKRYNLDVPEIYYVCTLELSKEYIERYIVENYKLSTLCNYFDIDIESEHDAFDDACTCEDLFRTLIDTFNIDINSKIKKYNAFESDEYISYISDPLLRKSISDFYGVVRGFSIDNIITQDEIANIVKWKNDFSKYYDRHEIMNIIKVINEILDDGKVTTDEILMLQSTIYQYLDNVNTSPITLSTQILNGILKGIIIDDEVNEIEIKCLRQWLYDNIYLRGHYPFDQLLDTIEQILDDSIVTKEEFEIISNLINSLLNPVESIKTNINSIDNKVVCLSGNFSYGTKSMVTEYIESRGGSVVGTVTKKVDYLIIGNEECQGYSNGTYGSKVKKAMEMIQKGHSIKILKEVDFFSSL